jgi:hypothetical protein
MPSLTHTFRTLKTAVLARIGIGSVFAANNPPGYDPGKPQREPNLKLPYIRFFGLIAGVTFFVTLLPGCATHSMVTSEVTFDDVRDVFLAYGSTVEDAWVTIIEDVTLESREQTESEIRFKIILHEKTYRRNSGKLAYSFKTNRYITVPVSRNISRKSYRRTLRDLRFSRQEFFEKTENKIIPSPLPTVPTPTFP